MSRTFKTDPHWVQSIRHAHNTDVIHRCDLSPDRYIRAVNEGAECDVDTGREARCFRRSPTWPWANYPYCIGSPPGDFIRGLWTGPDRRRSREDCADAAREYNHYGETDVIVGTNQHRHNAQWSWW